MHYVVTNQEPLVKNPNTVYIIKNSTNDNYTLIETDENGNAKTRIENYLSYIRESINDYKNQFYGRYKGLIIPLYVDMQNILTYVNTIIQSTNDKKYPIGVILLFPDSIQYNSDVAQAINLLIANNIMVFGGISVNNRNLENILANIDEIIQIYPQIRGLYFDNVNLYVNNNDYLSINILTGYAFYRDLELVAVGFSNLMISDQNLMKIISDLFVYDIDFSIYPQFNVALNVLSKNRLVFIGRNKQSIQYSDIEEYLTYTKFCYFTDQSNLNSLATYFQSLVEFVDRYNFKMFVQKIENIDDIIQNMQNKLNTVEDTIQNMQDDLNDVDNTIQNMQNNLNNIENTINYINSTLNSLTNIYDAINHLNMQIDTINLILQSLQQQQSLEIPLLNLEDYIKFGSNTKHILYGKTYEADTQFQLNKNFIYLIPFRMNMNATLKQVFVYKLFDRKASGKVYIGIYESDFEDNPTNKLFETEIVIDRLFGLASNNAELNIPLQAGKIYYFAITANDNILLRGLTVNNIKTLFGIYFKNNKPLTGFVLPTRTNILPDIIDIQKIVPYFDKLPAIYTVLDRFAWNINLEMTVT